MTDISASSSPVYLPVRIMQAALSVVSTEESRYYLCGVHVSRRGNALRIQATDGHRLFLWQRAIQADEIMPEWLTEAGIIVSSTDLAPRLSMIANSVLKSERATVTATISYTPGNRAADMSDYGEDIRFRQLIIDGTFPETDRVIPEDVFADREFEAGVAISFNPKYLRAAGDMAAKLDSTRINLFSGADDGPSVATFGDVPGAALIIMPMRSEAVAISESTAATLAPAMRGTLIALRAHETRTVEALKTATDEGLKNLLTAKLASFQDRIRAIVDGTATALPAPAAKPAKAPKAAKPAKPAKAADATGEEALHDTTATANKLAA